MPKITFHSHSIINSINDSSNPSSVKKDVPDWFVDSSRFWFSGEQSSLSFKACPALIDAFLTGYFLKTPCDIEFVRINDRLEVKLPPEYKVFCEPRPDMQGFPVPHGYDKNHFHWYPNWMPGLEDGYSALYVSPLNRFDLPFITVSGIIDSDKMNTPGLMPFFIKEGFEGVIKKGTPFVQIIPYKREEWFSDLKLYSLNEMKERHFDSVRKFRIPEGGGYKKTVWERKKFQ